VREFQIQNSELRIEHRMSNRLKWFITLAGLILMLLGLPALLGVCAVAVMLAGSDPGALSFSLGWFLLLIVTIGCGGAAFIHGARSLGGRSSGTLRLPPTWALGGGFFLALAVGLGLRSVEFCAPIGFPPIFLVAVLLPPVAAVAWMVDRHPGGLTWRRATVAFAAGATVSVGLAIALEVLLPGLVLALVWGLADLALPALEGLIDALAGGDVAAALTSPGFLFAAVQLAVVAPLVEEFVKPLVILPLLKRLPQPRDALLMGAVAGAGFAVLEDAIYAGLGLSIWAGVLLVRALGAAIHPLGAALTAWGWHELLGRGPGAGRRWIERYGLAVGIHALWNGGSLLVLTLVGANFFGTPAPEVDVLGVTAGGILLALLAVEGVAVWVGARALARRLLPVDVAPPERRGVSAERAVAVWALVCLLVLVPAGLAALRSAWWGGG
jgi:RsiW-degrading membrane proteinase PrsW (M82 family)